MGEPEAALRRYLAERDFIIGGKPPLRTELTLIYLVNHFLTFKKNAVAAGEIVQLTYVGYKEEMKRLLKAAGRNQDVLTIGPAQFQSIRKKIAIGRGPVSLENDVVRFRCLFKYAYE